MSDLEQLVDQTVAAAFAEAGAVEAARAFREKPRVAGRGSPRDLRIARHEMAHAVICWLVGGSPLVEIVVRDDASGEMTNEATARAAERPPGDDHADRLAALRADHPEVLRLTCARHIVTVLAGISADHEAGYGDWTSSFDDLAQANRLAEIAVGRGERDRLVSTCKAIARLAVHDAQDLIGELGDLLVRERRLEGPWVTAWLEARPEAQSLRSYYSAAFEAA